MLKIKSLLERIIDKIWFKKSVDYISGTFIANSLSGSFVEVANLKLPPHGVYIVYSNIATTAPTGALQMVSQTLMGDISGNGVQAQGYTKGGYECNCTDTSIWFNTTDQYTDMRLKAKLQGATSQALNLGACRFIAIKVRDAID